MTRGYESSTPATQLTPPPTGPAPGVKVHKYRNDDPTETWTACGIPIWVGWLDNGARIPIHPTVDADARKTTCGNCARSHVRSAT